MVQPTVAVIVTCYNQERFIRQALDSLVTQSHQPDEIVVIDGFSQDRSVEVIQEWIKENETPITFIVHDRNYGLCATLNQAMDLVTADYVVTLYGDDWLVPTRLEHQLALFSTAADDVCMVIGGMREVDRRGAPVANHDYTPRIKPLIAMTPDDRVANLVAENVIPSPAVMLRSALVRKVGGYDESLTFDDYDMWMRLLGQYTLICDPQVVVNYRVLTQSLSRSSSRHGDFLLSEAKMIFKHVRVTPATADIVRNRLRISGAKLAERGDRKRLRALLRMLRSVDHSAKVIWSSFLTVLPWGARTVHSMRLLESHVN